MPPRQLYLGCLRAGRSSATGAGRTDKSHPLHRMHPRSMESMLRWLAGRREPPVDFKDPNRGPEVEPGIHQRDHAAFLSRPEMDACEDFKVSLSDLWQDDAQGMRLTPETHGQHKTEEKHSQALRWKMDGRLSLFGRYRSKNIPGTSTCIGKHQSPLRKSSFSRKLRNRAS